MAPPAGTATLKQETRPRALRASPPSLRTGAPRAEVRPAGAVGSAEEVCMPDISIRYCVV